MSFNGISESFCALWAAITPKHARKAIAASNFMGGSIFRAVERCQCGLDSKRRPFSQFTGGRDRVFMVFCTGWAFPCQVVNRRLMKKTLAITADLGNFNVYLWETASFHRAPRLELINAFENTDAHTKRANTLTVLEKKSAQKALISS